ncbi:MAG: TIGR02391 family protein [Dehalococcoidales bacterium]|nr:TIGR02391 family protein [Dehalococcoidales bacterium]
MDKKEAIQFLREQLERIPPLEQLPYDNSDYPVWCNGIEDVLENVFNRDSVEYKRFADARVAYRTSSRDRSAEKREYLDELKMRKTAILSIIQKYERLGIETAPEEPKDMIKSPVQLFDAMKFHTKAVEASRELFRDGHYRDAIYRAFVEVNSLVKRKANSQLDGKGLMSTAFSLSNPLIKLNPLITQTDRDEQEGFMYLFMGAMQGIRNPKAHENIIQNDPYVALHLIGFASVLMQTISFWNVEEA